VQIVMAINFDPLQGMPKSRVCCFYFFPIVSRLSNRLTKNLDRLHETLVAYIDKVFKAFVVMHDGDGGEFISQRERVWSEERSAVCLVYYAL